MNNESTNLSNQLKLSIEQITIDNNEDIGIDESLIIKSEDETSNEGLVVDVDGPIINNSMKHQQQNRQLSNFHTIERPKVAKLGHNFNFNAGTSGSSGSNVRVRQTIRGTSKRGRPRGSRRGGGQVGGKGRGMFIQVPGQINPTPQSPGASSHLPSSSSSSSGEPIAQQGKIKKINKQKITILNNIQRLSCEINC